MTLSQQHPNEMLPVKVIPLTQGQCAIVDPEDFELVSQHKWSLYSRKYDDVLYAITNLPRRGGQRTIQMHCLIMGQTWIDHKNGDGLDNRRCNIRVATPSQNQANTRPRLNTSSKYKGVSWHERAGKWKAYVSKGGTYYHLGLFVSEEEAARAYDAKAGELFGEFARLNFKVKEERNKK